MKQDALIKDYCIIECDGTVIYQIDNTHDQYFIEKFKVIPSESQKQKYIKDYCLVRAIFSEIQFCINCYSLSLKQYKQILFLIKNKFSVYPEFFIINDEQYENIQQFKNALTEFYQNGFLHVSNIKIYQETAVISSPYKKYNFYSNCSLKKVKMIDGKIVPEAFCKNCKDLEQVVMPDSIEIIDKEAFEDCINLKQIHFPKKLKYINADAFASCEQLTNIVFENSLIKICECAFEDCINLKSIFFPKSLKEIKTDAFSNCKSLTEIYIPSTLQNIQSNAFKNCLSLSSIVFY